MQPGSHVYGRDPTKLRHTPRKLSKVSGPEVEVYLRESEEILLCVIEKYCESECIPNE